MSRNDRIAKEMLELATDGIVSGKHLAVWDWLYKCPLFSELYFIFSDDDNGDVVMTPDQIISPTSNTADNIIQSYIDNSHERLYDFIITIFLPKTPQGNTTENLGWANTVESLAAWVEEQNDEKIFPEFGAGYTMSKAEVLALPEGVAASDDEGAKYMFGVRFTYKDETKRMTL